MPVSVSGRFHSSLVLNCLQVRENMGKHLVRLIIIIAIIILIDIFFSENTTSYVWKSLYLLHVLNVHKFTFLS